MKTFATAVILSALCLSAISTSANAMTAANLNAVQAQATSRYAKVDFVFGDEILPGRTAGLNRLDAETTRVAAQAYYDFDAIITFGMLALGGATLAAVGFAAARRGKETPDANSQAAGDGWRETVLQSLERDLTRFTNGLRRAA